MKNSLCILIRRPPYGQIHAAEAIRHIGGALAEGLATHVVLLDDGVYVARDGQNAANTSWTPLAPEVLKTLAKGARYYVHAPSAAARGLEELITGVEMLDDGGLADLLAASDAVMVY